MNQKIFIFNILIYENYENYFCVDNYSKIKLILNIKNFKVIFLKNILIIHKHVILLKILVVCYKK